MTTDWTWMQALQVLTMQCMGRVLKREDGATDTYNRPVNLYLPSAEMPCGVEYKNADETRGAQTELIDVELRLPFGTSIKTSDRFQVTQRYGVVLETPESYEIVTAPEVGPTATLVQGRRLTI